VRIRLAVLALIGLCAVALATVAGAQIVRPASSAANVRVLGRFTMTGTVTVTAGIPKEHRGQRLTGTWHIRPIDCVLSDCPHIVLTRDRDSQLTLRRTGATAYRGTGTFWVPVRCQGRTYAHGSLAPYVITLRATRSTQRGAIRFATAIAATYVNPARSDRTACPLGIVHDGARYSGALTSALPDPAPASTTATTSTTTSPGSSTATTPAPSPATTITSTATEPTSTVPIPTLTRPTPEPPPPPT
jgi:hypothetical protein